MAKFTNTNTKDPKELTSIKIRISSKRTVRLHDVKARVASDIKIIVVGSAINATIRTKPNNGPLGIWNVDISAGTSASTKIEKVQAKYKDKIVATLDVEVSDDKKLELPNKISPAGLLTRLFLAESLSPRKKSYDLHNVKTGMQWMKLVIYNRRDHKDPTRFGAKKGGKGKGLGNNSEWDIFDIVMASYVTKGKSSVQFHGFDTYPAIPTSTQTNIDDILKIANDYSNSKQEKYASFVKAAISVAQSKSLIVDPCSTGLYGWRTSKSAHPGKQYFDLYKTYAGQDFYTLKVSK